ncbi:Rid family detoxifying hydrolase [Polycladidibacter stylochi]|uniref:Rid family detoxifying hydrolase n=1 Tax=Polycladidibacter stylochi TaxID=1807766 RepID=UPI00082E819B
MSAITTDKAPAAIGPYVQGMKMGNQVITSGQLPIDVATGEMPIDPAEQATQSLNNALAIIEAGGLSAQDVVKATVFVKDLNHFGVINEAYAAFFDSHQAGYPARSCVEVARLPKDALVEIELTAVKS